MGEIIGGLRPDITKDTPRPFANLINKCWSSEPSDRPTMTEIVNQFYKWFWDMDDINEFCNSEKLRKRLMEEKPRQSSYIEKHPEAFHTSRPLGIEPLYMQNHNFDSKLASLEI
ncbi:11463_t:CDS:1 [Acaulospora colombiana]|uniref:11463_t:CDS:1 n=1 Tax=Acaulospora colombiana TaxID=27376 RepID=A0ACA9LSK7_9GLOM|nr:11463_t:CDS:1 [Acaulospora colombiana]